LKLHVAEFVMLMTACNGYSVGDAETFTFGTYC